MVEQLDNRNAVLVVGHQPQLGWLSGASHHLRRRSVPIAASVVPSPPGNEE